MHRQQVTLVQGWIVDFSCRVAYRIYGRQRILRRDAQGAVSVVSCLPAHVQAWVDAYIAAKAA